jgi:hypothetical protein
MTKQVDYIQELISQINPEQVPVEFIVMAQVTTYDGEERFVSGSELESIIENPDQHNVQEARVILDIRKIRQAITRETQKIFRDTKRINSANLH